MAELNDSLKGTGEYEVLICDNASSDGTADLLSRFLPEGFRLIRSDENLGFAKGNNLLIRQAKYERIVLLNPDVFDYPKDFWRKMDAAIAREGADVGFVKLHNPDGSFQDCIGDFPSPARALASLLGKKKNFSALDTPTTVDVGIMAFMVTHRALFESIGLIDEDFHMYCEDVEWCCRAHLANKKVLYFPEFSLTHLGGASAESRWKGLRKELVKYRSESLFLRKHHQGFGLLIMIVLNLLKRVLVRIRIELS